MNENLIESVISDARTNVEIDPALELSKEVPSSHSFLLITSKDKGKVFEINNDGSVGYTVNGEYKIADNDKTLGIALGQAFETLAKLNEETIRKQSEASL